MDSYLDIAVVKCPRCKNYFADSSWFVVEAESDLDCGKCGKTFNGKETLTDRILAKLEMDENGKVKGVSFEKGK